MKKLMMILAVLFAMVGSSFGEQQVLTSKVKSLRIYTNKWNANVVYFRLDEMPQGLQFFSLDVSDPLLNAEIATLLNAKNSKSDVTVWFENGPLSSGPIEALYIHLFEVN